VERPTQEYWAWMEYSGVSDKDYFVVEIVLVFLSPKRICLNSEIKTN
jgi:hypothetical protein